MSWVYPVIGLWLTFLFGLVAFLGRKKKFGALFQTLAIVTAFFSVILFLWWGVLRAVGLSE